MKKELQQKLANLLTREAGIRLKYEGKSETMTGQEETEWTGILDEADKIQKQLENLDKGDKLSEFAAKHTNALPAGDDGQVRDDKGAVQVTDTKAATGAVIEKFAQVGRKALSDDERTVLAQAEKKSFSRFLTSGLKGMTQEDLVVLRAYQADSPASGGFLVAPQQFVQDLITLVKDMVFIRGMATTYQLDRAESLGIPSLDVEPSDADWTAELATGNEETTFAFGKRELRPHPLAKRVKLSNKLLRQAAIDPEGVVRDRLAYKFGVTEEKAFLSGSGANQPLGVFTASATGISTARDTITTGSTAITADDVMNLLYSLKPQYQEKAHFMFHRTILLALRKLKDSNNNYIWASGLGPGGAYQGAAGTLLGRPYTQSEYCPNTVTTGLYTMIVGDFSKYVIATALDMQLQVLDQLYAETNQTGYIARLEVDGMPVLEEAFSRLRQA